MALFFKYFCGGDFPDALIETADNALSSERTEEPPPVPASLVCDEEEFYRAVAEMPEERHSRRL